MGWDYKQSKDRIQKHLDNMGEIKVEKLVREADLNTLLSETNCRQIYGAHVYVHVSNFARLLSKDQEDKAEYKRVIRALHIYQQEVGRIVESDAIFDGLRIHFQGPKLHAIFYRPIDKSEKIASKAVLLQLVLMDFVRNVFNPAFPDEGDFSIAGGTDIGNAIGTRNGTRADRELLFVGAPANHAAKIICSHGTLRLTKRIYDVLPQNLKDICGEIDGDIYQLKSISQNKLDELLAEHSIGWDRKASEKRITADKERYSLDRVNYSSADVLIDIDDLSIYNNKRVLAVSVYGDVTGFTAYIDAAKTEEEQRKALRVLHALRKEMATVVKSDFNGIRIQFQGDRVQALYHIPKDGEGDICTEAVDAAVALQSSMEKTIKACLSDAKSLHMAVGVDTGTTLVSKLGTRGHRDRLCVGEAVEGAAHREEKCSGEQIGITKRVHNNLPLRLKEHFQWDSSSQCYVATGLTTDKVQNAAKATSVYGGTAANIATNATGYTVSSQETTNARKVVPARSYSA